MKSEWWQQIDRLWDEALSRPQDEREAFLDRACLGDEALRREVALLLAAHEESEGFIEAPAMSYAAALLADTSVQSMVGRTLGHYEIRALLGAGGMGEVFLAQDAQLNRPVALKLLPAEFAGDENSLLRFEREAKAVSSLNHPHIITVHEVGEAEGWHFIATEYIDGVTLRRYMSGRTVNINEALEITIQIAAALSAAHEAGVVHSDIKPENVMIRKDGYLKVLDFGLAKLTGALPGVEMAPTQDSDTSSLSDQSSVIGTLPYMSPEQARGFGVDARTDIWSLGIALYELMTGELPFSGSNKTEVLSAILERDFPSLPLRALPAGVEGIVRKALHKDVGERYQTAAEMLGDLRELKQQLDVEAALGRSAAHAVGEGQTSKVLTGNGHVAPGSTPDARRESNAFIRTHYLWLGLVFAVLAASAVVYWNRTGSRDGGTALQKNSLEPVHLTSFSGMENDPALSPDGDYIAFSWHGEKEDNLDIYVQPVAAGPPRRLTTDTARDKTPAWSPDGQYIVFSRESKLFLIEAGGGIERSIGETSGGSFSFYPGGKLLAITDRESAATPPSLYQLNIETSFKKRLTAPPANSFGDFNPVISPDGRTMAFCRWFSSAVNDIYLMPADGGGEPRRLTTDGRLIQGIAWTEDGNAILFSSNRVTNRVLWRIPVSGGEAERAPIPVTNAIWPSISRRGSRLVFEHLSVGMNIWRLEKPGPTGTARPPINLISSSRADLSPQYSPDGKRIAFRSDRSGHDEIWLCDADGSRPTQLTNMNGPLTGSPKWSPDGRWIVFDSRPDGQADLFVIGVNGEGLRRLTDVKAADVVPSWSADGRMIYFGSNRGGDFQIYRMPAEGGEAQQVTKGGGFAPVASTDGRLIYYAKGRDATGIWRVPTDGGEEVQVVGPLKAWMWGYWAVTNRGIYYVDSPDQNSVTGAAIDFYDFSTGGTTRVAALNKIPSPGESGLAVSPDDSNFLYAQADQSESDIILVKDYH